MFRNMKNGDRLAVTELEKRRSIEATKELIRSEQYITLFNKAKEYAIKGEYEKTLKAFEDIFNEYIKVEDFIYGFEEYFKEHDILEEFDRWEKEFKIIGTQGFYCCVGTDIIRI